MEISQKIDEFSYHKLEEVTESDLQKIIDTIRNSVYEDITPPFDARFEDIDWEVDANESKNKEERRVPKRFAQLRKK